MPKIENVEKIYTEVMPWTVSLLFEGDPNFDECKDVILQKEDEKMDVNATEIVTQTSSGTIIPIDNVTAEKPKQDHNVQSPTIAMNIEQLIQAKEKDILELRKKYDSFSDYAENRFNTIDKLLQGRQLITDHPTAVPTNDDLSHFIMGVVKRDPEIIRQATMVRGTPDLGGYLIPDKYATEILDGVHEDSRIRAAGPTVLTVNGFMQLHFPIFETGVEATPVTAELAAATWTEPTVDRLSFQPYRYRLASRMSFEAEEDAMFNILRQWLQLNIRYKITNLENTVFTTGTGVGQPQGVLVGSTDSGITAAAVNAVTANELLQLIDSLHYMYQGRAKIMMHQSLAGALRRQMGTSGDGYLWEPNLQVGSPARFAGLPIIINNNMPNTTGTNAVLVGDFSKYYIIDYRPLVFKVLDQINYLSGYYTFAWMLAMDAKVVIPDALHYLSLA